jgi:hypothetical protein
MLSGKDNNQPANIARLMALGLRKLNTANEKTAIWWITQLRDNIGGMSFGPRSNATGGKAKHYYVSQELMLKKIGKIYETVNYFNGEKDETGKQVVAQQFMVELTKSRFGQPHLQQYFIFDYATGGIDQTTYLIQQGLDIGNITKKGAWWNIILTDADGVVTLDEKAGSKDKFNELVSSSPEIQDGLLRLVCDRYGLEANNYAVGSGQN